MRSKRCLASHRRVAPAALATILLLVTAALTDLARPAAASGASTGSGAVAPIEGWDVFGSAPLVTPTASAADGVPESVTGARPYVVSVVDGSLDAVTTALGAMGVAPDSSWDGALSGLSASMTPAQAAVIAARADVLAVEPNRTITATDTQVDPPWGLDRIDQRTRPLDGLFSTRNGGAGVDAYVIDSGLWLEHNDFAGRVVRGGYYDFGDGWGGLDCSGHGTHVTGTLAGTTYGVAKQAWIIPVKVLNCSGNGSLDTILQGISWVLDDHQPGKPAVANLSVGGPISATLDAAVQAMIDDGITVVVAAGNDARPTCNVSPARLPAAITVAAVNRNDAATFSNYGECNDIFAPGTQIRSAATFTTNGSIEETGTSMAAPHVAGAAALILAEQPHATPADVWNVLAANSTTGVVSTCCGDPDRLLYVEPEAPPVDAATLVATPPVRLLDTRVDVGLRAAWSTTAVAVTGRAGVPGNATAAVLNVTVTEPAEPGFLTVHPCGVPPPTASNVNFTAGQTIANVVLAKIGAGGSVCIFTSTQAHVVVDLNGWFPPAAGFGDLTPARLLDTRLSGGPNGAGGTTVLPVRGLGGVNPAARAVALNVTVTDPQWFGYATVFPCGRPVPTASNLNYAPGQTIANAVVADIGAGDAVCIYTSATTHLVVDVNGWFPTSQAFGSLVPARLLDTRETLGMRPGGSVTDVVVAGRGGVPTGAAAAVLNVTATEPQGPGFVTVYPCGGGPPLASNLNYAPGETIPNAVVVKLDSSGRACLFTPTATHLVVDVNAWFAAP